MGGGGEDALACKIGARICERRTALGISRVEFASVIGISEGELASIEGGLNALLPNQLSTIATALDLKLIDLLG